MKTKPFVAFILLYFSDMKKSEIFRNHWIDFSLNTGIRGFSYMVKPSCLLEKLFWAATICCFIGLTVSDVLKTINLFTGDQSVSRITVLSNSTTDLGQPTFCFEFDISLIKSRRLDITDVLKVDGFLSSIGQPNLLEIYDSWNFEKGTNWSAIHFLALITLTRIVYAEQYINAEASIQEFSWGSLQKQTR